MVENKRSKNSRQRGSHTHGYGSMKKHRGAGSRGGRGRAGSGKRGDSQKPSLTWKKGSKYKGKIGFTSLKSKLRTISIAYLEQKLDTLLKNKLIEDKNGVIQVDLSKLKADKLLSNGSTSRKYSIACLAYSARAKEKIEAAGGSLVEPVVEKEIQVADKKELQKKEETPVAKVPEKKVVKVEEKTSEVKEEVSN